MLNSGVPSGELSDQVLEQGDHGFRAEPDLLHGVQLSDGDSVVLHGAVVDRDGEGNAALVSACVPPADGLLRVVNLRRDARSNQRFLYTNKQGMMVSAGLDDDTEMDPQLLQRIRMLYLLSSWIFALNSGLLETRGKSEVLTGATDGGKSK